MSWADAVVHWLHLMAAILWVGGTLFASVAVQPVLEREVPHAARMAVYRELGRRLTAVQWATWAILLATGSYRLWLLRGTPEVFFGPFGRILAAKLALVAGMAALSLAHSLSWGPALVAHSGSAPERAALARRARFWGKANLLLMAGIVFCAALLRFNPW